MEMHINNIIFNNEFNNKTVEANINIANAMRYIHVVNFLNNCTAPINFDA